jgi:hypothetical protein
VFFCHPEFDFFCVYLSFPWYLICSLDLQDVQWAVENSRATCKLARTPHANKKKKKKLSSSIQASSLTVHSWYLARTFSFNCPFFAFYFFVKYEGEEITS